MVLSVAPRCSPWTPRGRRVFGVLFGTEYKLCVSVITDVETLTWSICFHPSASVSPTDSSSRHVSFLQIVETEGEAGRTVTEL